MTDICCSLHGYYLSFSALSSTLSHRAKIVKYSALKVLFQKFPTMKSINNSYCLGKFSITSVTNRLSFGLFLHEIPTHISSLEGQKAPYPGSCSSQTHNTPPPPKQTHHVPLPSEATFLKVCPKTWVLRCSMESGFPGRRFGDRTYNPPNLEMHNGTNVLRALRSLAVKKPSKFW